MKRRIFNRLLVGLVCLLFWCAMPQMVRAAQEAEELTNAVAFSHSRLTTLSKITDKSYTSKIQMQAGDELALASDMPIGALYLIFDRPPAPYSVQVGDTTIQCGENGFLHETIYIPNSSKELVIHLPESLLCEVYVFSKGVLPDFVQDWNQPYEDCDLLLLPTHADDEHIFFGGIMPYYAGQEGKKVQVAYLTNHWGEPYRPHELLNGLWTVGVRAYPVISEFNDLYSMSLDHAKTLYDTEKMLAYQVELIRRFKPEVIVGHDINGEYGHGVHRLNTHLLMQAVEKSGDSNAFADSAQKYGTFDVPKTYLHLYGENAFVMDVDKPLSAFGGKTAYEMAVEGFAQHRSQQKWFSVEKSGKYDCRKFGLYRTTVGQDTGVGDLFEHIEKAADVKPEAERVGDFKIKKEASSSHLLKQEPTSHSTIILWIGIGAGVVVLCGGIVLILQKKKRRTHR